MAKDMAWWAADAITGDVGHSAPAPQLVTARSGLGGHPASTSGAAGRTRSGTRCAQCPALGQQLTPPLGLHPPLWPPAGGQVDAAQGLGGRERSAVHLLGRGQGPGRGPAPALLRPLLADPGPRAARFESWSAVFEQIALVVDDKRHILILDEVTYAAQSDPNFYVALQHAWDQHFLHSRVILVLCGSHVRMMSELFGEGHPLFGRFTLPLYLEPLAFAQLRKFFPRWSAEERVAGYAMVGGISEYYEWLEPTLSLRDNLRQRVIQKPSPFLTEARFLLYDNLEQPAAHLSVIRAIGDGRHTFDEIRLASEGASHKLTPYLDRLRDLRLIERTVSALIRPQKRKDSKNSRWVLSDPFLRFYFRFVAPALEVEPYDAGELTELIWGQLRAFVGQTAFEEICRDWVRQVDTAKGVLPFRPTYVGRHWSKTVEADVIGIQWEARQILIGECKWDDNPVSREQARRLVDVTAPKTLADLARQAGGGGRDPALAGPPGVLLAQGLYA